MPQQQEYDVLYPPPLRAGDTIAVVAPGSPVNMQKLQLGVERIEAAGYRVRVADGIDARRGYLAGDDRKRAGDIMEAVRDPGVRAVLAARGGYGCGRLLGLLDYAEIRKQPKIFAGFSDITALHAALSSQCRLVTFHSPHPIDGWGEEQRCQESEQAFWRLVTGEPGPPRVLDSNLSFLVDGEAEGRLMGGNAAVFTSLLGSPYEPSLEGCILFLEDVGERPYRIDRMLCQLKLAGRLQSLAGIVLGYFTDCVPEEGDDSLSLDEVFEDYLAPLGIPVARGLRSGHERPNLSLPLGATVRLSSGSADLTLCEWPVSRTG